MTVSVGFAPTTTPGLVTGTTTAAPEADAPEGLFAALLAMLAPAADAEAANLPETITSTDFAALVQQVAPNVAGISTDRETQDPAATDPAIDVSPLAELPKTEQGKSLLKNLSDALIALSDALEAGTPVDPALERKLTEAVDAVAAYLGVTIAPPVPTVDPRISALASGEGVLPTAAPTDPAADLPTTAPADPPVTEPVPAEPSSIEAAPEPAPLDDSGAPTAPAPQPVDATAETPDVDDLQPDPAAPVTAVPSQVTAQQATTVDEAPPALRELGLLIGKLSERLEPTDPVLAKKLAALADGLQSGTVSDEMLAALGIDATDDDPDLARVIEALSAPKPAARPASEPQPFTLPTLALPDAIAPAKQAAETDVATPVPAAPSKLGSAPLELAKPTDVATVERDAKPADTSPPAVASTAAATSPSTDTSAQANTAVATQPPAAAPVARTVHAAYQVPVQQVNLPQVAFEVVRQFDAGNSRFQIRLDPPELGRIDVKLDVDKSGTVNARMTVERPETLDLMQRDQRALQLALQQAGLDASRTNLEFSLRQNPFAAQGGMSDGGGQQSHSGGGGNLGTEETIETAATLYRGTATAGGVNLIV